MRKLLYLLLPLLGSNLYKILNMMTNNLCKTEIQYQLQQVPLRTKGR
jgi:hypothetical protein